MKRLRTEPTPEPIPREERKKKKRSPGPRGRITKRSEDLRSKPDRGREEQALPPGVLSGRAVRHLRALGHHLTPIVQIGKEGITDGVVLALRDALLAHELVKVRVASDAPIDRKAAGVELAKRAAASLAQVLGRTLLLYKRHPHKPKIELPR